MKKTDEYWMEKALEIAQKTNLDLDVPVGAIVVNEDQIIGSGFNQRGSLQDPTAHAEILAIREAAQKLGSWRLLGCRLYVTLEPCVMCTGALALSRVEEIIYAAKDPKGGAIESIYTIFADQKVNHRPQVTAGVLAIEAEKYLKDFFKELRKKKS